MATIVTADGKVTLPRSVLEAMGIGPGSEVDFLLDEEGNVVIVASGRKRPDDENIFESLRGAAGPGPSTDEIMALTRGDA